MKLIVTVDSIGTAPFGFVGAVSRDEDTMIEVWKGIQIFSPIGLRKSKKSQQTVSTGILGLAKNVLFLRMPI